MATYYIKPSGSDAANGLTPTTAWATIGKVFASGSVVTGGDTIYIAPGAYRELITAAQTAWTSTVTIIGDPTASLVAWGGIQPGKVRFTSLLSGDTANASSSVMFTASSRGYMAWQNIAFEGLMSLTSCGNTSFTKCLFQWVTNTVVSATPIVQMTLGTTSNYSFSKCIFDTRALNINGGMWFGIDSGTNHNVSIVDCVFTIGGLRVYGNGTSTVANNINVFNCTFHGAPSGFLALGTGNGSRVSTLTNCFFVGCTTAAQATALSNILLQYSRALLCQAFVSNISQSNNDTVGALGVDVGENILFGLTAQPYLSNLTGYANVAFGTVTGAPTDDLYGKNWVNTIPDAGAMTYQSLQLAGGYYPTERNASLVTIAPGATSQSIELYLGATGLTAYTSGLSAYYNRTRTASVNIPLVARTIAQAWTSGGFAEVDATNMPGVYRLDLPDAALAAGADDVTVVVRGASGTNGAVISIRLATSGLTSAQTASAVLDAVGSSYVTAGSIGYAIQNSNVASISGSTAAADELEGALLHNGTDYISAELVTPVTSAALVRMGPYEVKADGLGASDPLDIQKGAQHGVDIQCVDANGSGIDITSATVTAKVYNSGATLVDTYSCTATYAADGRATFTIDTTVTNSPGTYTATITRTTGASDTQVFGPLRIYVRDI